MRVTILADNKVLKLGGFKAEWGFSALIETASCAILFDAGQSVAFENFIKLEKSFPEIIVLSHGHYDHSAGLLPFLKSNVKLYAHPDAFLPRFYDGRHIGIPFKRELIESLVKEIVEVKEPREITKNVWVTGEIPRIHRDSTLKDSYIVRGGKVERDNIVDDQAIAVKTDLGVVLLLGCCHSGLENTVEWVEEITGDEVKYIIGGTHMMAYKEEEVKEVTKKLDVELLAPCHCTGFKAEAIMQRLMGDKFLAVGSGSEIEI